MEKKICSAPVSQLQGYKSKSSGPNMIRVKARLKRLDKLRNSGKITGEQEKKWTADFTKQSTLYHIGKAFGYGLGSKPEEYHKIGLSLYILERYYNEKQKPKVKKRIAKIKEYGQKMGRKNERYKIKFVLNHVSEYREKRLELIEAEIKYYHQKVTVEQVLKAKYGQGVKSSVAGEIRKNVDTKLAKIYGHNYTFVEKSENTIRHWVDTYYALLMEVLPQIYLPDGNRRPYLVARGDPYLKTGNKDMLWLETLKDIKHMKYGKPYRPKTESKEPKYAPVRSTDDYISDDRDYYDDYLTAEEEMAIAQNEEVALKQWEIDKYQMPFTFLLRDYLESEDNETARKRRGKGLRT